MMNIVKNIPKEKDIKPTFTCFTDVLEFVEKYTKFAMAHKISIVHGIKIPNPERRHSHAWIEWFDDYLQSEMLGEIYFVDDVKTLCVFPRKTYYQAQQVTDTWEYTIENAWKANELSGYYGPWVPELLNLCGDFETKRRLMKFRLKVLAEEQNELKDLYSYRTYSYA